MTGHDRETGVSSLRADAFNTDTLADATVDRSQLEALAKKHDKSNMAEVIARLPEQIEIALEQEIPERGSPPIPNGPFDRVVIAGMGGSVLPMDVLTDAFAEQLKTPVIVWRHYDLPPRLVHGSLIIVSSFSGGTEETLSAIGSLPKDADNVVVICREDTSSDKPAKLGRVGAERGFPVIRIPVTRELEGFQPRSAVGYLVTFLARLLSSANVLDDPQAELIAVPPLLREAEIRPAAESAAMWLRDRIPVVYTDQAHYESIARIAKIKFNENSKRPAFYNALPEANHNDMVGLTGAFAKFGLLYLHDPESHPCIRQRFQVMKKLFEEDGFDHVGFREWQIPGTTNVQRVFAALAFADWCSYTLALLDGINPTPVKFVERFKQELKLRSGG